MLFGHGFSISADIDADEGFGKSCERYSVCLKYGYDDDTTTHSDDDDDDDVCTEEDTSSPCESYGHAYFFEVTGAYCERCRKFISTYCALHACREYACSDGENGIGAQDRYDNEDEACFCETVSPRTSFL